MLMQRRERGVRRWRWEARHDLHQVVGQGVDPLRFGLRRNRPTFVGLGGGRAAEAAPGAVAEGGEVQIGVHQALPLLCGEPVFFSTAL